MSYRQPDTGNTMNDYFTNLSTFVMLAPKFLGAPDERSFEIWREKLELVDRRALLLFLRKHKDELPPEHLAQAQYFFKEKI